MNTKFHFIGAVTQYNIGMDNVNCSPKQQMLIQRADYGDFKVGDKLNISANTDKKCSILTNCQVKSLCGGKRSCDLTMDNNLLPSQYCSDTSKEIYTQYTCVDNYNSNTITGKAEIFLLLMFFNNSYLSRKIKIFLGA